MPLSGVHCCGYIWCLLVLSSSHSGNSNTLTPGNIWLWTLQNGSGCHSNSAQATQLYPSTHNHQARSHLDCTLTHTENTCGGAPQKVCNVFVLFTSVVWDSSNVRMLWNIHEHVFCDLYGLGGVNKTLVHTHTHSLTLNVKCLKKKKFCVITLSSWMLQSSGHWRRWVLYYSI